MSDKFGDHGIIGSYIFTEKKNYIAILDFLLSCRILSRKIEEYIIYLIKKKNIKKEVYIIFIKTEKNKELINIFLSNNFFKKTSKDIPKEFSNKGKFYKVTLDKKLKYVKKFF